MTKYLKQQFKYTKINNLKNKYCQPRHVKYSMVKQWKLNTYRF